MITTIIFDMDGTLYDTEKVYKMAWLEAGVPLEVYRKFIGTSAATIRSVLTENGMDPDVILRDSRAVIERELAKGIELKPGARELLQWLKEKGYRTGIATSSTIETARRYLTESQMTEYFDEVISGNQLEHGKPHPDIFLMAADQLQAAPKECMVVEDSFNGVRAGHAAGMFTVMVPDLVQPDEEIAALADAVISSLSEIRFYL